MRRRCIVIACVIALTVSVSLGLNVRWGHASVLPRSMASTGDSMTRGFDSVWYCALRDCPGYSWSTGDQCGAVDSQYCRLLALDPAIRGHNYNDASTGAQMSALDGQLHVAARQGVDYVTVLMGANDLCTGSVQSMTPTWTFESEFYWALADFTASDPNAIVAVSSIPDLYRLWQNEHGNWWARFIWSHAGVCQSMLSSSDGNAQRQQVAAHEAELNAALETVCSWFSACRWDGGAVNRASFPPSDVSGVDFFHPNLRGQNDLARVSFASGPLA